MPKNSCRRRFVLFRSMAKLNLSGPAPGSLETSPPDTTQVDDASIARAYRDFKPAAAAPGVIDEEPPAAIHASNIAKTAIAEDSFALAARDCPAIVEAAADRDVDCDGVSGRWRGDRHHEAQSKTKASEQKAAHTYSPCRHSA